MMSHDTTAIRQRLEGEFDLEELRTLCMDLGVDFDSLRGEGKAAKARELVLYMQRRGRLDALVAAVQAARDAGPAGTTGGPTPAPGGQTVINTGGGAYIGGNVTIQGGDFVGRDKIERGVGEEEDDRRRSD